MMQVAASVRRSRVHGLGLFAEQPIAKGSILWRYDNGDRRVPLATATDEQKHFGYVNPRLPDFLVVCGDHSCYWNFPLASEPANAGEGWDDGSGEAVIIALNPISAGDELLIATTTDADAARKLSPQPTPFHG